MITTVLFDLDDTLYDEVDFCRSGYRAVAAFLSGVPNLTASPSAEEIFAAFWREFEKGNRDKVFDSALAALGVAYEADTIDHLVRIYREHRPDITLPTESRDSRCSARTIRTRTVDRRLSAHAAAESGGIGDRPLFQAHLLHGGTGPRGLETLHKGVQVPPEEVPGQGHRLRLRRG